MEDAAGEEEIFKINSMEVDPEKSQIHEGVNIKLNFETTRD
jgi:hypothetical protein